MKAISKPIAKNIPISDRSVTVLLSRPVVFMFAIDCRPTGARTPTTTSAITPATTVLIEIAKFLYQLLSNH